MRVIETKTSSQHLKTKNDIKLGHNKNNKNSIFFIKFGMLNNIKKRNLYL